MPLAGRPFDPDLLGELESLANRGYTDGFYQRHESHELQNYRQARHAARARSSSRKCPSTTAQTGLARLEVKNKIRVGDELELVSPRGNRRFRLELMQDKHGNALDEAPGGGWEVQVRLPEAVDEMTLITRFHT